MNGTAKLSNSFSRRIRTIGSRVYSVTGTSREELSEFLYGNKPWFSERLDEAGNAQRTLHVPPGMSEDEARRILGVAIS
jgi:hypothetical protein